MGAASASSGSGSGSGSGYGGSRGGGSAAKAALDEAGQELFECLRAWRTTEAKAQAVPAYIVFNDATLAGIAEARPSSIDELSGVSGVGAAKLERYGDAVLAVVAGEEPPAPEEP